MRRTTVEAHSPARAEQKVAHKSIEINVAIANIQRIILATFLTIFMVLLQTGRPQDGNRHHFIFVKWRCIR